MHTEWYCSLHYCMYLQFQFIRQGTSPVCSTLHCILEQLQPAGILWQIANLATSLIIILATDAPVCRTLTVVLGTYANNEFLLQPYLSQLMRVPNDNEQCLSSADGHIEPLWVGEEAKVMTNIRVNHTYRWTNLSLFISKTRISSMILLNTVVYIIIMQYRTALKIFHAFERCV